MKRRVTVAGLKFATLISVFLVSVLSPTASAASDPVGLPWEQQNQWLLQRTLTPEDATGLLGIPGLTMASGGEDRLCAATPDQGVTCRDNWGGGSWDEARAGVSWPAVALPRGVTVRWNPNPDDAFRVLDSSRGTFGVLENLPLQISGFDDHGGNFPVGWSFRVSGGWFVTAFCDPAVLWNSSTSTYSRQPVTPSELVDCAKRVVAKQFEKLGVVPAQIVVPDPPSSVLLTLKGSTATATWIAPKNDGGAPVLRYQATSTDGSLTCSAAPTLELIQSCTAPNAALGVTYTFTVTAKNVAGVSPASNPSQPSKNTQRASPPRKAKVKVAGTSALLTWKRPSNSGGLPILKYQVSTTRGSHTCTTESLSCTVLGLNPSTRYQFTVTAINGRGASTAVKSKWVKTPTPQPPPTPAPNPTLTPVPEPELKPAPSLS